MSAGTAAAVGIRIAAEDDTKLAFEAAGKALAKLAKQGADLQKAAGKTAKSSSDAQVSSLRRSLKLTQGFGQELAGQTLGQIAPLKELWDGATGGAKDFGAGVVKAGAAVTATGVGMVAAIVGITEHWANAGAEAGRLSQRLNIPVESLSKFQIAARLAGSSSEEASAGLQNLQATLNAATHGQNNDAFAVFKSLGIDIGDMKRGARSVMSVLGPIAEQVQRLFKINPEAAAHFLEVTGLGRDMLFVFKDGAAGLAKFTAQAAALGPITEEDARKSLELQKAQVGLSVAFERFGMDIAGTFAPAMTELLKTFEKYLIDNRPAVELFFKKIEAGLESILKPDNLTWLRKEFDTIKTDVEYVFDLVQRIGTSTVFKSLFGGTGKPLEITPEEFKQDQEGPSDINSPGNSGRRMLRRFGFHQRGVDENGRREGDPGFDPTTTDGYKAPTVDTGPVSDNGRFLHDYLRQQGNSEAQTAGILGYLRGESGSKFDPHAFNPDGGGQGAQGIAQWRGARVDQFRKFWGHDPREGTIQEEAWFLNWELHNSMRGAGDALSRTNDPAEAGRVTLDRYGIPSDAQRPALEQQRAGFAEQYYRQFTGSGPGAPLPPYAPGAAGAAGAPGATGTLRVEVVGSNLPPGMQLRTISRDIDPHDVDIAPPATRSSLPTPYSSSPG